MIGLGPNDAYPAPSYMVIFTFMECLIYHVFIWLLQKKKELKTLPCIQYIVNQSDKMKRMTFLFTFHVALLSSQSQTAKIKYWLIAAVYSTTQLFI